MKIKKQKDSIRIKPGKTPTHIFINNPTVRVGEKPLEFKAVAFELKENSYPSIDED